MVWSFAVAFALDAPVTVEWAEGSACRSDGVVGLVDAQLVSGGAAEAGREAVPVDARVAVVDAGGDVRATVELVTPHGESVRELEAESCDSLHESIALLLAMHVDPLQGEVEPEEVPVEDPPLEEDVEEVEAKAEFDDGFTPSTKEPSSAPLVELQTEPEPERAERVAGLVRAGFGALAGPFPGGTLALFGGAGVHWRRLRFEVRGSYALPRRTTLDAEAGSSVLFSAWSLGPSVCFEPRWDQISIALCGLVEAGRMRARPRGIIDGRSRTRPYVIAGGGPRLHGWFLPWLNGWVGLEAGGVLVRPRFEVSGGEDVHVARPWVVFGAFGLEAHFG